VARVLRRPATDVYHDAEGSPPGNHRLRAGVARLPGARSRSRGHLDCPHVRRWRSSVDSNGHRCAQRHHDFHDASQKQELNTMNRLRCAVAAALLLIAWPGEGGSVFGRVVDAAGRPPASVRIEVVPCTDADAPGDHGDGTASKNLAGAAAADGSFRIQLPADWPPSEIHISSSGSVTLRAADVVTGADDSDLGLLMLPSAQVLQGVVRDESGQAISGAHVKALAVDGRADLLPGEGISDQAGRYLMLNA